VNKSEFRRNLFILLCLAALFLAVSYVVERYEETLQLVILQHRYLGVAVYIFLAIAATVAAPVSMLPFLPLMSSLYGWFSAGVYSIVGWSIGSYIAFKIARKWGKAVVKRFLSLEQLEKLESKVPEEHLFWNIILLRIIIPADALSYALGIFSTVRTVPYMAATIVGIIPFAFIWAYIGVLPFYETFAIFLLLLFLYLVVSFARRRRDPA